MSGPEIDNADFLIELADWSNEIDRARLRSVREAVFIVEQQVPDALEWDDLDATSQHVVALESGSHRPIGCGRLTPLRAIGRMAVMPEWRGRGVGAAIMRTLLEQARVRGMLSVELHAQTHALEFYRAFGFEAEGPEYDEAGIPHQDMRAEIAAPDAPDRTPAASERHAIATLDEARSFIDSLAAQARHRISIFSLDGDPLLLDRPSFVDEIQRVALSGRGAVVRLLLRDARRMARDGHRLLELARRLPSFVEIRCVEVDESGLDDDAFVFDDVGGVYWQPRSDSPHAEGSMHDPHRAAAISNRFEHHWQRAQPNPALRRLTL
ncbi:MAG: GNAT family N-acetyltransferase [Lysobacterales bacterium]